MFKHLVLTTMVLAFAAVSFAEDSTPVEPPPPTLESLAIKHVVKPNPNAQAGEAKLTPVVIPAVNPADAYAIGIDDILDVNILQPEKMSIALSVAPDGSINMPYIGHVFAKGFSLAEVQTEIQNRLAAGYMQYPVVSVTLRESRSRKYSVYGQVARPGSYPVTEDNLTVLGAISQAGGFNVPGSSGIVKIIRPKADGSERIEVKINSVMNNGGKDVIIKPGDTLMVYEDKFFVYGEVQRPGPYPLEDNVSVLRAISMAGGFNRPGSSGKVKIIRPAADGEKFETLESAIGDKSTNIMVHSGDTIMVYEDKFFVYGEVQRPGPYPLEENMTVLKAISMAGGFTKFGSSSRVKCLRPYGDKPGYMTFKLNVGAIMDGNTAEDLQLKSGDIIVVSEGIF